MVNESTRRPTHTPAPQKVHMDMEDRLTSIGPGVHDHSISRLLDSFVPSQLLRGEKQLPQLPGLSFFQLRNRGNVGSRNNEDMSGSLWIDVPERYPVPCGFDHFSGNLPRCDATE